MTISPLFCKTTFEIFNPLYIFGHFLKASIIDALFSHFSVGNTLTWGILYHGTKQYQILYHKKNLQIYVIPFCHPHLHSFLWITRYFIVLINDVTFRVIWMELFMTYWVNFYGGEESTSWVGRLPGQEMPCMTVLMHVQMMVFKITWDP